MRSLIGIVAATGLIAIAASPAQAANWTLDFNALQRGEIVDNQYATGIPGASSTSVVISAIGGVDNSNLAVAFDTNNATTGSNNGIGANDGDSDLSHPFDNNPTNFGNILIVQEQSNGTTACGAGATCIDGPVIPDDDIGSSLTFDFGDTPTDLVSIDYFDIENTTNQALTLEITYADATMATQQLAPVGDHDWGIFDFGGLGLNVMKLTAVFSGSGAIDNLLGRDRTTVSEPETLAIFLTGLAGLMLYRRRRKA